MSLLPTGRTSWGRENRHGENHGSKKKPATFHVSSRAHAKLPPQFKALAPRFEIFAFDNASFLGGRDHLWLY